MKKLFLILLAVLGISYAANAQSCKISGSNDGSTIMVTQKWMDRNTVKVNLSNDSEKTCANVTVSVEVIYGNNQSSKTITRTYTGSGKSCPDQSCMIEVDIPEHEGWFVKSWKVQDVSGNKCN